MRKINYLLLIAFLCLTNKIFATSKIMFDLGRLSLPIMINNEEASFCPTIVIPDMKNIHKIGKYGMQLL